MTREHKIQLLQDIAAKRLDPRTLVRSTPHFVLPANDGTDNVHVITKYGSKVYTRKQFRKLELSKGIEWIENKK